MPSRPEHTAERTPEGTDSSPPHGGHANVAAVSCWVGAGGDALASTLLGEQSLGRDGSIESAWGWRLVAIGGDRRATASACAARAGASEVGSIRELARSAVAAHLLLGREAPGEADLDLLLAGDAIVVSTAPVPPSTAEGHRLADRVTRLRFVPMLRWSEALRTAQPLIEEFLSDGVPAAVAVRMSCPDDELGIRGVDAMLLDACDAVLEFVPAVESIAAIGRSPSSLVDARVLSAIGRSIDGCVVSIAIADVGTWDRSVELTGPGGRLLVSDRSLQRWSRSGAETERIDLDGPTDCVGAILESIRTLSRTRGGREERRRHISRLALADATRLSARTGNPESPASVEEIAARP
jgi:hypothetical protein